MDILKDKLNEISKPLDASSRKQMQARRENRHWWKASAAIALKVNRQLKSLGMTRKELAAALNITPANITRYLDGKCNFELRTLVEMERVLNIRIIDQDIIPNKTTQDISLIVVHKKTTTSSDSFASDHFYLYNNPEFIEYGEHQ